MSQNYLSFHLSQQIVQSFLDCLKKFRKKSNKVDKAVSSMLATFLLLLIVISAFSIIYYTVSSTPPPTDDVKVTIVGKVEGNDLTLLHRGGESLSLYTEITLELSIKNDTFLVKQYLDADAQQDGTWDLGEKINYPLPFTINNIQDHFTAKLIAADIESNSLVFIGSRNINPQTDLTVSISADNLSPPIGSTVNLTIIVTNQKNWETPAINIALYNLLPMNLVPIHNITSRGAYNSETGMWNINYIDSGESVSLTITAIAKCTGIPEPTQIAMILDGSTSIASSDWDIMRTGLANAIENPEVFPHYGNVELTVIQFGQKYSGIQYARKEIGPILVTESNYQSIGNTIRNLPQLRGYTPMGCGIYLTADTMIKSPVLTPSDRQVICLVTDGQPNCNGDPKTYTGTYVNDNYLTGRNTAEQARNYLINTLQLNSSQDQFDVIAVGQETNTLWLKNKIVWPEPGNYAPPYVSGWVRNVSSWQQFSEAINEMFRVIFNTIRTDIKIISMTPSDPFPNNNEVSLTLKPVASK